MATQTRTYQLAPARIEAVRTALENALDVKMPGDSGQFQAQGFTVKWARDGETLSVTLDGSGWKMPFAWAKIEGYIT